MFRFNQNTLNSALTAREQFFQELIVSDYQLTISAQATSMLLFIELIIDCLIYRACNVFKILLQYEKVPMLKKL